jgi:uncharacterized phiE125 gp8 family phage protein
MLPLRRAFVFLGTSINTSEMYTCRLITAPTEEPVSLEAVKNHLAIESTFTDFDDLIVSLTKTATQIVEDFTQRGLVSQTWELVLDAWPCASVVELPMAGPLASITSVKYTDEYATTTTVSTDVYAPDTDALPGRIYLKRLQSWPTGVLSPSSPVKIRYIVGQAVASVPEIYKTAITYLAGRLFESRNVETVKDTPCADRIVKDLLGAYRLYSTYPVVRGL